MTLDRWWVGAGVGLSVGLAALFGLRATVSVFRSGLTSVDFTDYLTGVILLITIGLGIAFACAASRTNVLITAVPALLFLIVFGPIMFGQSGFPSWYPDWMRDLTLESYDIHIPVVFGVLAGAATWNAWRQTVQAAAWVRS